MSTLTVGMPKEAKAVVFQVATGQTIKAGDLVYLSGDMEVSVCTNSAREAIGVAAHDFPYVPGSSSTILYGADATDRGPSAYVSTSRAHLTVILEGAVWLNVQIPAAGTDITLVANNQVVASAVAAVPGCVDLYDETPAMAGPTEGQIQAAFAEQNRIIGTCIAQMHLGLKSNSKLVNEPASLGSNLPASGILVADGAEIVYGKVPVILNIRRK